MSEQVTALERIKDSLSAKLPGRVVTRSLIDPANTERADLLKGVLCVVNKRGDRFANYRGREGQLGHLSVYVVGFVVVDEDAPPVAVEDAELSVLSDVLAWCADPGSVRPVNTVLPEEFAQSGQQEHPYGWVSIKLDART